jgi:hypothetical protein
LVKEFIIKSLLNPRLAHVISFLLIMVLMREPNYNCQPAELVRACGGVGWGGAKGGQRGQTVS